MITNNQRTDGNILIDSTEQFHQILAPILDQTRIIAIDCEGSPDLSKTGTLCVLQLCAVVETQDEKSGEKSGETIAAYVVDALAEGAIIQLLKPVLESTLVLKVIHDVRRDAEALFFQFDICLVNVLDTQVAYRMILMSHLLNSRHYQLNESVIQWRTLSFETHLLTLSRIYGFLVHAIHDDSTTTATIETTTDTTTETNTNNAMEQVDRTNVDWDNNQLIKLIRQEISTDFVTNSKNQVQGLAQVICDVIVSSHLHPNNICDKANTFPKFSAQLCYSLVKHLELGKKLKTAFKSDFKNHLMETNFDNLKRLQQQLIQFLNGADHFSTDSDWPVMSPSVARHMALFHFRKMLMNHARFLGELFNVGAGLYTESALLNALQLIAQNDDDIRDESDKLTYQNMISDYLCTILSIVGSKLGRAKTLNILEQFNWINSEIRSALTQSVLDAIQTSLDHADSNDETKDASTVINITIDQESEPKVDDIVPFRTMLADISLVKMLLQCTDIDYSEKMEHRSSVREDPEYWKVRPLSPELADIAAKDVLNLIPLYEAIRFLVAIDRFRYPENFKHIANQVIEKSDLYASTIRLFGYVELTPASYTPFDLYNKQFVKFEHKASDSTSEHQILVILDVKQNMGRIIGRFGRNLQALQIMSPSVNVFTFRTAPNRLYLIGIEEEIQTFIQNLPKNANVFMHKEKYSKALNRNMNLIQVEQTSNCSIYVFEQGENKKIRLCGTDVQIDQAKRMIAQYTTATGTNHNQQFLFIPPSITTTTTSTPSNDTPPPSSNNNSLQQ